MHDGQIHLPPIFGPPPLRNPPDNSGGPLNWHCDPLAFGTYEVRGTRYLRCEPTRGIVLVEVVCEFAGGRAAPIDTAVTYR